jgi:UDP-glucose 4-epimerase
VRVLVTGGAGYVGTELVGELARWPDVSEIVIYDNLSRSNFNLFLAERLPGGKPLRFVQGDVLDTRKLKAVLDGVDAVYHLAARVSTPFADADFHGLDQVNHWGTAELSYLLDEVGVGDAPDPHTAYGISKLRGEQMLARLADRCELYTVRCANVYGYSRSMRFDAVINRFLFEAHFNGRITVHGSGHQRRGFVHVRNAARALAKLTLTDVAPGICDLVERNLSVLEITSHLQDLYPDLELLFLQQDIKLRNLVIRPDARLAPLFEVGDFAEQLRDFKASFSFAPAR